MATIKITQLPPIGSNLAANTVLPVVNVAGTAATDKTTVAAIGNLILTNAGGANFAPAALANLAYSVVNAAQPNITSVGTLPINTFRVSGGVNGQYLQTDGTGNLSFVSGGGSGNGVVGGANTQIQYNNAGNFGGSTGLTWNGSTGVLSTLNLSVSSDATIYGDTALSNLNVADTFTANNIFTDNYFYANGDPFSGGNVPIANNSTPGIMALGNGFVLNGNNQVSTSNLYNTNLTQPTQHYTLNLDTNGVVHLPDQSIINGSTLRGTPGTGELNYTGITIGPNSGNPENTWMWVDASNAYIATDYGNVGKTWTFDSTGNLTLPANTFSINYANGTQVPLGGGGNANTGNIGFSNNVIYSNIGVVVNNSDLGNGQTAGMSIPVQGDGNTVSLYNTYGNVTLLAGNVGNSQSVQAWTFGADGNLIAPGSGFFAGQNLYVGEGANSLTQFNAATLVISANDTAYIQAVVTNVSDIGSADWVAYGHHGNDAGGWVDMGFTSASYSDANFTITGPGDGYVFAHGYSPGQAATDGNGNLVLATGEQGNVKDIVFATGGFLAANEFMKISHANNALELTRAGASIAITDDVDGNIESTGNVNITANSYTWSFNGDTGDTTFPDGTVIQGDGSGIYYPTNNGWNLHRPDNLVWIGSGTNVAYIDTYSPNVSVRIRTLGDPQEVPGYDWIFDPTGNLTLPTNTFSVNYANGQRVQLGGGNIASLANGTHQYTLQNDGSLLSTNNSTPANFVVNGTTPDIDLRNTSGTGLFTQSANVTIRTAGTYNWIFDNTGNLSVPGELDIHGGTTINFHQQVGNFTWGTNYMALSQYGRINTNVDFFANSNVIGAQYLKGDGSNISNVAGANVSGQVGNALVAGTIYTNAQPNITSVGTLSSLSVTGNVSANNFTGNGKGLSNVATQTTGNWTLASGTNTVTLSVPGGGTYTIWVNGNIPNGIVTYIATAVVTNTNVPVLGEQYGWYYEAGNALVLTSIPNQFVGTQGAISNAAPYSGNTANVFTFGITNNSGANAVVNWGYTKL